MHHFRKLYLFSKWSFSFAVKFSFRIKFYKRQSKETRTPHFKPNKKFTNVNLCHSGTNLSVYAYCTKPGHLIYKCNEFQILEIYDERFNAVKSQGLCVNCLKDHKDACASKIVCIYWGKRHNSLLHHHRQTTDITGDKSNVNCTHNTRIGQKLHSKLADNNPKIYNSKDE